MLIAYVGLYLAFAAATARAIFELQSDPGMPIMLAMLGGYLISLLVTPYLVARSLVFLHIVTALQTAIGMLLLLFMGNVDYFSLLFIPPCVQGILHFPRKTALVWIGLIIVMMAAALLASFPLSESIGYVIIYPTAIFLFTALSYLAKQAQEAQERSEALLADLQIANRKLQDYAAQAQELAAAGERNRLARELHDSVTQIIFGLTLSAQAARILIDRDPPRAAAELEHLQALAGSALAEMRALIQELHPANGADAGLAVQLHRLAAERQTNDGLTVDVQIDADRRLPAAVESELFRIAQEALNNVVKHAHAKRAVLALNLGDAARATLRIVDDGIGFDPTLASALPGHLGLTSMAERVQALGGTLEIDSQPGKGTRLTVEIALEQEVEHA